MDENERKILQLVEMADCDADVAKQLLESTNWDLQGAVELISPSSPARPSAASASHEERAAHGEDEEDSVRAPMEARTETMIESLHPHSFPIMQRFAHGVASHVPVVDSIGGSRPMTYAGVVHGSNEGLQVSEELSDRFKPIPPDMLLKVPFDEAKRLSRHSGKFLIVSVASNGLVSHRLNSELWNHPRVMDLVRRHIHLLQPLAQSPQGQEILHHYKIEEDHVPVVLLVNHFTGAVFKKWHKELTPVEFRSFMEPFLEKSDPYKGKMVAPSQEEYEARKESLVPSLTMDEGFAFSSDEEVEEEGSETAMEVDGDSDVEVVEDSLKRKQSHEEDARKKREMEDFEFAKRLQEEMERHERIAAQTSSVVDAEAEHARLLREQQDVEFAAAESEAAAREAEEKRLKEEEEERRVLAQSEKEQFENLQSEKRENLLEEPAPGKDVSTIRFRAPEGRTLHRRFRLNSKVSDIADFLIASGIDMSKHVIETTFPRKMLTDMSMTLAEADLKGPVALNVTSV